MQQKKMVPFGRRMCLSWLTISEGLLLSKLGMEELFSFGLMFGMTFCLIKDFQSFSLLPRIQIFLWPSSSKTINWSASSIYHFLNRHISKAFLLCQESKYLCAQFLQNNQLECQFHLPLSEQAHLEYQELQQAISQIQVDESTKDSWHYASGNSTYLLQVLSLPIQECQSPPDHSYG
jgi:hypothetical protein